MPHCNNPKQWSEGKIIQISLRKINHNSNLLQFPVQFTDMIAITIEELDDIQMTSTSKVTRRRCVGGQKAIAGALPANPQRH